MNFGATATGGSVLGRGACGLVVCLPNEPPLFFIKCLCLKTLINAIVCFFVGVVCDGM